jgi:hypothetical protein
MQRVGKNSGGLAQFKEVLFFHHTHPVRKTAHQIEVMGDEEQGHAELALQVVEQGQDLRLHREIQRRGGLVVNEKLRLANQGHGALALAAVQLRPEQTTRGWHGSCVRRRPLPGHV